LAIAFCANLFFKLLNQVPAEIFLHYYAPAIFVNLNIPSDLFICSFLNKFNSCVYLFMIEQTHRREP
jgi:hypothetical protein